MDTRLDKPVFGWLVSRSVCRSVHRSIRHKVVSRGFLLLPMPTHPRLMLPCMRPCCSNIRYIMTMRQLHYNLFIRQPCVALTNRVMVESLLISKEHKTQTELSGTWKWETKQTCIQHFRGLFIHETIAKGHSIAHNVCSLTALTLLTRYIGLRVIMLNSSIVRLAQSFHSWYG